jgi:tRNA A-37 threonylcarbamoyl transferase component Bud32
MTALEDRLRAALAPDYEVERELASGGMGTVFLGRDVALQRQVAIKVLRPDLATAAGAERFIREARVLASFSHPHIVAVHRAGEAGGLSYLVMDYVAAETLAARLERGPLPPAEAVAVAADVLTALEVAHAHGVVHRDVKPANVFLCEGRAVLGDFGIATSQVRTGDSLTVPGRPLGTPDYMAPEQLTGKPATPATDICAVGLLLYEALTGQRFEAWDHPERADWSSGPRALAPVVRRALAWDPAARWPSAAAFRSALLGTGTGRRNRRIAWATAGVVAAAALALLVVRPGRGTAGEALDVAIGPFRVSGAGLPAWLGDSVALALDRALGAGTDFRVRLARAEPAGVARAGLWLDGAATARGDTLVVTVASAARAAGTGPFQAQAAGPLAEWPRVAGELAYQVLWQIWRDAHGPLAADLPRAALPQTTEGLRAFLSAELLYAQARWAAARQAYERVADADTTCLLCEYRVTDVGRWLGIEADTARTRRYRDARGVFPPQYRRLIDASFAPEPERLEQLHDLTDHYRHWGFGFFIEGDEIFHRGAFAGWSRHDALQPMEQAALLLPDFAPVWEHLAWIRIAEGDSAGAAQALQRYQAAGAQADPTGAAIGALLGVADAWRFSPEPMAIGFSEMVLANPLIAVSPDLAAAPANLLSLEVPRAALWLGAQFARGRPRAGLETTGRLAQLHGLIATGRVDSGLALAGRLGADVPEPDVAVFVAELPAALALVDSADVSVAYARLAGPLRALADATAMGVPARSRALWMLAQLAWRARRGAEGDAARRALAQLERPGGPLGALLDVLAGPGAHQVPAAALRRSEALVALDSASCGGDPFYRMLLHLARADWQLAARQPAQAARELRWHENNDFVRYSGQGPQAVEVDYAFGALARWRRARVLEPLGAAYRAETCAVYAEVARQWRGGDAPYSARADSARQRLVTLHCADAR